MADKAIVVRLGWSRMNVVVGRNTAAHRHFLSLEIALASLRKLKCHPSHQNFPKRDLTHRKPLAAFTCRKLNAGAAGLAIREKSK